MVTAQKNTLHVLPLSHPCMTARAALDLKGLEYEVVTLKTGPHIEQLEATYGAGKTTVPGLVLGDEPIHGSTAILERLEQLVPESPLYPDPIAAEVREAELWGDREFQDLGRRLPWGALRFRPEWSGTYSGGDVLDPAGTDYAMKYLHMAWKHAGLTAAGLAEDLNGLPEKVARIEAFARDGLIDGENPTAADLQIGSTARVLLTIGDLDELFGGTAAERIARRFFPEYPGHVPAGALPAGWAVTELPAEAG